MILPSHIQQGLNNNACYRSRVSQTVCQISWTNRSILMASSVRQTVPEKMIDWGVSEQCHMRSLWRLLLILPVCFHIRVIHGGPWSMGSSSRVILLRWYRAGNMPRYFILNFLSTSFICFTGSVHSWRL